MAITSESTVRLAPSRYDLSSHGGFASHTTIDLPASMVIHSRDASLTSTRVDHSVTDFELGAGARWKEGVGQFPQYAPKRRVEDVRYTAPADEFPEGGKWAWMTLVGGFLLQYASFGYVNAFGVYQDFYARLYLNKYTPSQIGWIGGTQLFFTFASGVVVGRLFDGGHFHKLVIVGIIIHALSLYLLSVTQANAFYQVFLTHGLGLGVSTGLLYIPSLAIVGHYFQKRRALGMGVVSAGSALGAVIHPIMLNRLMTTTTLGFRNTLRVSATLNVVCLIVGAALCRTRLPPKETKRFPILQWIREPAYFWCLVTSVFIFLGLFYPVFYIQLLSFRKGVSPQLAFYTISILNAGSFIGRVVPPALSHHVGVFNMEIFALIAGGIVVCFMSLIKDAAGAIFVGILFGFFSGAGIALVASVVGLYAKDMSELGTRLGLVFALGGILALFAQPIAGGLLTDKYNWLNASLFAGLSLVLAGLFGLISRYYLIKSGKTTSWKI